MAHIKYFFNLGMQTTLRRSNAHHKKFIHVNIMRRVQGLGQAFVTFLNRILTSLASL